MAEFLIVLLSYNSLIFSRMKLTTTTAASQVKPRFQSLLCFYSSSFVIFKFFSLFEFHWIWDVSMNDVFWSFKTTWSLFMFQTLQTFQLKVIHIVVMSVSVCEESEGKKSWKQKNSRPQEKKEKQTGRKTSTKKKKFWKIL